MIYHHILTIILSSYCLLPVLCYGCAVYTVCILHVYCMYTVYVFCMYTGCILYVYCMYDLTDRMKLAGITPNQIVFTSAMEACAEVRNTLR